MVIRTTEPTVRNLHVEYAGGRITYGILFIFSLFYEYSNLESVHLHIIYRVQQAEYGIRIRVAAPQEYVNTYSTRRVRNRLSVAANHAPFGLSWASPLHRPGG